MRTTLCALCAFLVLTGITRAASESDKKTLKGITGISVLVEEINNKALSGLTRDALQTDIELRLRKAGVEVHDPNDKSSYDLPLLYVNVHCLSISGGMFAFNIEVQVQQAVHLRRDPSIVSSGATTWKVAGLGTASSGRSIRDHVEDLVDNFLNDYLAANPEKVTLGSR
jgi:hypothetical protein